MEFCKFILEIESLEYGIAAFNTYHQNGINHCYMMVAEKGHECKAFKIECSAHNLNKTLDKLLNEIKAL